MISIETFPTSTPSFSINFDRSSLLGTAGLLAICVDNAIPSVFPPISFFIELLLIFFAATSCSMVLS